MRQLSAGNLVRSCGWERADGPLICVGEGKKLEPTHVELLQESKGMRRAGGRRSTKSGPLGQRALPFGHIRNLLEEPK